MDSIQTDVKTLQSELADKLHSLAQRQTHITFGVLFVLVVFMGVAGFFGYRSIQTYDKLVAAAQKQTDDFNQERKTFKEALDKAQSERDNITKQQDVIVKVVHDRDESTDKTIANVTLPDRDEQQVRMDVAHAYQITPPYIRLDDPHTYEFLKSDVQLFTATKLDRDRLFSDWQDSQNNLGLEQQKNTSLSGSLAMKEKEAKDAEALADKWEHVAHKTKMRRFLDGLERGGEIALTGFAAYKLGEHSGR